MTTAVSNLSHLPPELILHCFSYCKDKELGRLAQVCILFNSLANDRTLNRQVHVRAFNQLTHGKYEKKASFNALTPTDNQFRFIDVRDGLFYEFVINSIPRTYQHRKLIQKEDKTQILEGTLSSPRRLETHIYKFNAHVNLILNDKSQPIAKEIKTAKSVFRLDFETHTLFLNHKKLYEGVNDIGCLYGRALIATDSGVIIYDASTGLKTPLASKNFQRIAGDLNKSLVYGLHNNSIEILDFSSNKAESTLLDKPSVNLAFRILIYIKDKCIKFGIGFIQGAKAIFDEMIIERKFYIVAGIVSLIPLVLVPFSDVTFISALIFCVGSLAFTTGLIIALMLSAGVFIGTLAIFEMWEP